MKKLINLALLALLAAAPAGCMRSEEEKAEREAREKARQDSIAAVMRAEDMAAPADTSTQVMYDEHGNEIIVNPAGTASAQPEPQK